MNNQINADVTHPSPGEVERLTRLVQDLQDQCASLRKDLAEVTEERNLYRQDIYERMRQNCELEMLSLEELKAISAGPVELLSH